MIYLLIIIIAVGALFLAKNFIKNNFNSAGEAKIPKKDDYHDISPIHGVTIGAGVGVGSEVIEQTASQQNNPVLPKTHSDNKPEVEDSPETEKTNNDSIDKNTSDEFDDVIEVDNTDPANFETSTILPPNSDDSSNDPDGTADENTSIGF